jgi:hypothetical protein
MSSNNSNLSNEVQQAVIKRMVVEWQQMAYSAEVNVRIAERIQDDTMKQRSIEQMARAEKALDVLREELEKLGAEKQPL